MIFWGLSDFWEPEIIFCVAEGSYLARQNFSRLLNYILGYGEEVFLLINQFSIELFDCQWEPNNFGESLRIF